MTSRSPSTETTVAAKADEAREGFLGLSPAQVVASALAAATSALAASFLGVAGTIVGAVVGSIVATIGSAVYAHSLQRAHSQLRVVRLQPVTRLASTRAHVVEGPGSELATEAEPDSESSGPPTGERRGRRWVALPVGVVGAAVLALGGITVAEALMGHPLSDAGTTGTTLRHAFTGSPAPASVPAPASTSGQSPTGQVPDPTSTAGSGEAPGVSPTGSATSPAAPDGSTTDSPTAPEAPTDSATDPATESPAPMDSTPATGEAATP
jgi:hypothetical protein